MLDGLHLETKIYEKSTVINWYTVLWLLEWRFNWIPSFSLVAEAGGFEPPVRLPVRQFSKLVVSATHPNFLLFRSVISQTRCKDKGINWIIQTFCSFFRYIFSLSGKYFSGNGVRIYWFTNGNFLWIKDSGYHVLHILSESMSGMLSDIFCM